jgi:hypothetical protein
MSCCNKATLVWYIVAALATLFRWVGIGPATQFRRINVFAFDLSIQGAFIHIVVAGSGPGALVSLTDWRSTQASAGCGTLKSSKKPIENLW